MFGRIDIEFLAGAFPNFLFKDGKFFVIILGKFFEIRDIDKHAALFGAFYDRNEGKFDVLIQFLKSSCF